MSPLLSLFEPQKDDWDRITRLVIDGLDSNDSKRVYASSIADFRVWAQANEVAHFNKAAVQQYRAELVEKKLAPASVNVQLSAIRKLAAEAAEDGLLSAEIFAGIERIPNVRSHGVRAGNWLDRNDSMRLLQAPAQETNKGKRDLVVLAFLLGCGLRRTELSQLTFEQIQERDGRWVVADLVGKGKRIRTVPIPEWAKAVLDQWSGVLTIAAGPVLRPVGKTDAICGSKMSPQAIYNIVVGYGADLKLRITPHDLRRTFAKLAQSSGRAPLEQIQFSLGHASIQTTERYLGARQNLADAPCDHLGLHVPVPDQRAVVQLTAA